MPKSFDRDEQRSIRHGGNRVSAQNANLQPLVTQLLSIQQMTQALANNPDADVNNAVNLLNQATGLLQGVLQKPGL